MKIAIKRLMFMAVFLLTFGLMGCGSTLKTDLSISDNFAGTRTMEVSIDKDTFDEHAPKDGFLKLAKETAEEVPECMKFSYEETKDEYVFCFVITEMFRNFVKSFVKYLLFKACYGIIHKLADS